MAQTIEDKVTSAIKVAKKNPHHVQEEDPKLLIWYDQAVTRMGGV